MDPEEEEALASTFVKYLMMMMLMMLMMLIMLMILMKGIMTNLWPGWTLKKRKRLLQPLSKIS